MNKKHLYNCSLGKDSTAELILAKRSSAPIDRVVYADLLECVFPQERELLHKLQNYLGIEFDIVKSDRTFESRFFQSVLKGKRIREHRGLPLTVGCACWVKRDMKVEPVKRWERLNKVNNGEYIRHFGFAKGEEHRLAKQPNAVSLLIENNITEAQAKEICRQEGLLNPLYEHFDRLGCWFCPKQPLKSWYKLYLHFPELWAKLKYYEKFCAWKLTPNYSTDEMELLFKSEKFLISKAQMSIEEYARSIGIAL